MLEMVQQAKIELEVAENFFQHATEDDVDIAILQVDLAKAKLNRAYKIAKEEAIKRDRYCVDKKFTSNLNKKILRNEFSIFRE